MVVVIRSVYWEGQSSPLVLPLLFWLAGKEAARFLALLGPVEKGCCADCCIS
jgi:hypothetical protein